MADTATDKAEIPDHVPRDLVVDFDRFTAPELQRSPHRSVRRLFAGLPPVFWTPRNGGHWLVANSAPAMRMLKRPDLFSSDPKHNAMMQRSPRTNPNQYDPPDHTEMRDIIAPFFELGAMPALEPAIRAHAVSLIDAAIPRGEVEFLGEIAQRYPVEIFLTMAGAPLSDRDRLLRHVEGFTRAPDLDDRLASLRALADDLRAYLDARLQAPKHDILSAVTTGQFHGRPLDEDERLGMAALLFLGGLDTVAAMLSFIMAHLATHPEDYRRLVTDPEIMPRAVHELIRVHGVASMERAATQDVEFEGVPFRRGDRIVFTTQTYGLDNPRLDNPLEVDFDRKMAPHTIFGGGPHRCIGAHLANLEIRVFLEEWTRRFDRFHIDGDGEPTTFSGIVWSPVAVPLRWSATDLRRPGA
jgi:cytochrome P450